MFKHHLANEEKEYFSKHGVIYVESFCDYETEVRPILKDIFDLISVLADQYEISLPERRFSREDFHSGMPYLIRNHRSVVGVLYDAVKKLPNYIRLAASPKHDFYCKELLSSNFVGFANRGYGIRMDNPSEDVYSTQLHQDYVSQLCSQNSAVFWSPLRDATVELGPVIYYPDSRRSGVFPILRLGDGSRDLVIENAQKIAEQRSSIQPEVQVCDCVIIHGLLLHESGRNLAERTRWSMISRYFDFTDATDRAINWQGGLQEGNSFEKVHPELSHGKKP